MLASAATLEDTLLPLFMAQQGDSNNYLKASDAWWALRSQQNMAIDEPVSNVMYLGGHNAFNALGEGFTIFVPTFWPLESAMSPSQILSIRKQLDLGARLIELDIHDMEWPRGSGERLLILKHGDTEPEETRPSSPLEVVDVLDDISDWLTRVENRNEIIFLDIQDETDIHDDTVGELNGVKIQALIPALENAFGDLIYTPDDRVADGGWPSRRELISRDQRVIIFTHRDNEENGRFGEPLQHVDPNGHVWYSASIAFRANGRDDPVSDRGNFVQIPVDDVSDPDFSFPPEDTDYFFAMASAANHNC